jgi:hydrogenase nickel incorporation protein HypA/HybF
MHEFAIAEGVVQTAVRHADGRRVMVVSMRLGALRQVVPETLSFAFELAARGTACEGARLEHELVPCRLRCPSCRVAWTATEPDFRCRTCASPAVVVSGNELEVQSIEVEDDACPPVN